MVKRVCRKLRSAAGASVIMALSIMMVIAALSASMLSIAVTAPQAAVTQQQEQQAYLAVTSAARLLQDILDKQTPPNSNLDTSALAIGTIRSATVNTVLFNGTMNLTHSSFNSSTFETHVTLTKTSVNTISADISAEGYSLTNVQLTFIP